MSQETFQQDGPGWMLNDIKPSTLRLEWMQVRILYHLKKIDPYILSVFQVPIRAPKLAGSSDGFIDGFSVRAPQRVPQLCTLWYKKLCACSLLEL